MNLYVITVKSTLTGKGCQSHFEMIKITKVTKKENDDDDNDYDEGDDDDDDDDGARAFKWAF